MKQKENYLDLVFSKNTEIKFEEKDGIVTLFIENKGVFNKIAQKLLRKPKVTQLHLEEFGSFIWNQIDGVKTVIQISEFVKEKFGEKAEPLLPRLVQYFKILQDNNFVKKTYIESKNSGD